MMPGFRYWISKNQINAVSILFDEEDKARMFSINVQEAAKSFPLDTIDRAIYNLSLNALNGQSES